MERVGGKNRFEVSINIAQKVGVKNQMILVNGFVFPDALAIAPYASERGIPILLTNPTVIPTSTHSYIAKNDIQKTLVVGGEGSVSPSVFSGLPSVKRISGKDRYEVATKVVNSLGKENSRLFLATGFSFADALTGSVLAAKQKGNILLTSKKALPEFSFALLKEYN